MALEVIGAGFGRTGTLSMKVALERLGFDKTHHMEDVFRSPRQAELWHRVGLGEPPDWDAIFEGYRASVDFPSSTYYAELLEHFPEAKVVLTTRDVDRWYRSARDTIFAARDQTPRWIQRVLPQSAKMAELTDATVWDRVFDGRFADEAYTKAVFTEYLDTVEATVPAHKLLVFEVSQGWEPLCEFLGCDVPDEPFPHVNDTASFQRRIRIIRALGALPAAVGVVAAVAAAAVVVRRRQS